MSKTETTPATVPTKCIDEPIAKTENVPATIGVVG